MNEETKKQEAEDKNPADDPAQESAQEADPISDAAEELAGGEGEASLATALEEAREEIAHLKDRVLREMAEAENLRRRAAREKEDTAKYAIASFARDMLAVADNLGRALDNLPEDIKANDDIAAFVEGVELTGRELVSVFEKHGVKEVHPQGDKFDHNLHQAMFEVETPEHEPGTVTEVMQIGYTIGDRLLRAAMVGVAKAPKAEQEADAQ